MVEELFENPISKNEFDQGSPEILFFTYRMCLALKIIPGKNWAFANFVFNLLRFGYIFHKLLRDLHRKSS